jgi:hypothetical protein
LNAEAVAYPSRFLHLCVQTALTGQQDSYCLCYPKQASFEPCLKSDGSLAYGAIAGSILRDPSQIPQLLRIASDAQAAFLALFRSRKLIAGTLGFTDFREFLLDVPAEDVLGGPLQV